MEETKIKKAPQSTTDGIRIRRDTKRKLSTELLSINRKEWGRPVTVDDLLNFFFELLNDEHRQQIQDRVLTNADRLEKKFIEYSSKIKKVSKDEFFGLLLSGAVKI